MLKKKTHEIRKFLKDNKLLAVVLAVVVCVALFVGVVQPIRAYYEKREFVNQTKNMMLKIQPLEDKGLIEVGSYFESCGYSSAKFSEGFLRCRSGYTLVINQTENLLDEVSKELDYPGIRRHDTEGYTSFDFNELDSGIYCVMTIYAANSEDSSARCGGDANFEHFPIR